MEFSPYSVSKISTYYQCPYKFKLNYIDKIKVPFETNKALLKGSHIHKILENNFDYNTKFKLTKAYTQEDFNKTLEIVKEFEQSELGLKTKKLIKVGCPEEDFAFKFNKEQVKYKDKEAHLRGSADLYYIYDNKAIIIDYKSGKDKSQEECFGNNQAKMYAVYMFIKFPEVQEVKASFFFIEHSTIKTIKFNRNELDLYIEDFKKQINIIENDISYRKQVTALCDWCSFKKFDHCDGKEEPFHISTGLDF